MMALSASLGSSEKAIKTHQIITLAMPLGRRMYSIGVFTQLGTKRGGQSRPQRLQRWLLYTIEYIEVRE
jgi:hypothetical protein